MNKFTYNNETKSFGLLSTLGEIIRVKHLVIVLVDPTARVVFELHQKGSIGLRLSDKVKEMQDAMKLNFTIQRQFVLDSKYPESQKEYEKFRTQMYELFG